MKPKRIHLRKSAAITNSRWLAYATAGAASAFSGANSAEATIHYSGLLNLKFSGNIHATFPLDPAGGAISFKHAPYTSSSHLVGGRALFGIFASAGASVRGGFFTCPYTSIASASDLSPGQAVSVGPFIAGGGLLAGNRRYGFCGFGDRGQFPRGEGFIGFKFNNGNGDQYGWARIRSQGPSFNKFTLLDYAYGDVGDRVRAGQKSASDTPALESLGGLALGAAGLLAWRKRRAAVARPE